MDVALQRKWCFNNYDTTTVSNLVYLINYLCIHSFMHSFTYSFVCLFNNMSPLNSQYLVKDDPRFKIR